MKKIVLMALLCLAVLFGRADEQKKITLSNDNTKETVNLSYCNIFVTLMNPDSDDEFGQVLIEIENLDEQKILALFHQPYKEKEVKKLKPSFQYDKLFGGTKGKRVIDPYNLETGQDVFIEPSNKYQLAAFNAPADKEMAVTLPIYLSKPKEGIVQKILGKEKLLLLRKQVIELDITVELKPSAEYLGLLDEYKKLKKDVDNAVFCTNKKHRPGVEGQKEPYQKRMDELTAKIDAAISAHGWSANDGGYQRFNAIKEDITKIDLSKQEGICRTHRPNQDRPKHQCGYCSLSLQQIYHKLDDLYKKIYTSNDRAATKASVMGQVNGLYNCCVDPNCEKHASAWSNGGDYKNKIIERYNRIQGL
ncbi:MAG: hypothetical protein K5896_01045 [Prevotella sp.]|nr:hypothetical protein [Prevotella sp.]